MSVTFTNNHGQSNGTTDVVVVAAASGNTVRVVRTLTFHNTNASSRVVTLKLDQSGTERIIIKKTLAQDQSFFFSRLLVLDGTDKLEMVLNGGTTDVQWTAHFAEVS